jgi:hypothetical protein
MKKMKAFALMLLLAAGTTQPYASEAQSPASPVFNEFPARTIFIKSPMAADPTAFFAASKALMFEVYKVGSGSDLEKIIKTFRADPAVESFNSGVLTGDYQAFVLILKTNKDKAWFSAMFKKAGLNTIKLVHNDVIPVEKM